MTRNTPNPQEIARLATALLDKKLSAINGAEAIAAGRISENEKLELIGDLEVSDTTYEGKVQQYLLAHHTALDNTDVNLQIADAVVRHASPENMNVRDFLWARLDREFFLTVNTDASMRVLESAPEENKAAVLHLALGCRDKADTRQLTSEQHKKELSCYVGMLRALEKLAKAETLNAKDKRDLTGGLAVLKHIRNKATQNLARQTAPASSARQLEEEHFSKRVDNIFRAISTSQMEDASPEEVAAVPTFITKEIKDRVKRYDDEMWEPEKREGESNIDAMLRRQRELQPEYESILASIRALVEEHEGMAGHTYRAAATEYTGAQVVEPVYNHAIEQITAINKALGISSGRGPGR